MHITKMTMKIEEKKITGEYKGSRGNKEMYQKELEVAEEPTLLCTVAIVKPTIMVAALLLVT